MSLHLDDHVEHFRRDGWAYLPGLFRPWRMKEANDLIRAHYGSTPQASHEEGFRRRAQVDVVPWFPQREREAALDDLEAHPTVRALTDCLLGDGWRSDYVMTMFSRPWSAGQGWHQDCPPEESAHFNLNRLVYPHSIDDSTGGSLALVPGSHRQGPVPPGRNDEPLDGEVVLRPSAGDVVFVHGHLWHSVTSVGAASRVSINLRALPAAAPDGVTDVCVYRTMRYRFSTAEVIETR